MWPEVEEILKRSPTVEATAVFEYLCRQQEGAFQQGQLRTLQRRIKQWKAQHGEAKEVMFPQKYRPGHHYGKPEVMLSSLVTKREDTRFSQQIIIPNFA